MTVLEYLDANDSNVRRNGPNGRIVLSSRVRLARNIRGHSFPGWAKKAERLRSLEAMLPVLQKAPQLEGCFAESMDTLTALESRCSWSATSSRASTPRRTPAPASC
ncbi:MAG: hypothetical protein HC841_07430 [Verrucomicrobiae bacterium]|nr:hypothetical protein [Verrucomicrobiae bacterium]